MPRGLDGSYSPPSGVIVNAGDQILPSQHNPFITDASSALSGSLSRDGLGGMRANLNMGTFKITNAADPASAQDAATKNYVDNSALSLTGGILLGPLSIAYAGNPQLVINSEGVVAASLAAQADGNAVFYLNRGSGPVPIWSINSTSGPFTVAVPAAFPMGITVGGAAPATVSQFSKGSNANGYWEKNAITGRIEQWGAAVSGAEGWSTDINFPTAFTDQSSISLTATSRENQPTSVDANSISARVTSLTTYQIGSDDVARIVSWHAVGY